MPTSDLATLPPAHRESVDRLLNRFFAAAQEKAARIHPAYRELWESLEANALGGKRFRPHLVLLAYRGFGGADHEACAQVGAAFELLHTALIVHDDVIDRDFLRRGQPNILGRYRDRAQTAGATPTKADHRGMSVAVIAGDLALINAFRLMESATGDQDVSDVLLQIIDEAVFASAAGELLDLDFSFLPRAPNVEQVLHMSGLKTAAYSFEGPLKAGAVLAGAASAQISAVGKFGQNIGTAYQLIDDVLGVFGDESETGKSTIGDLREGKRTAMIAHAASTPQWQEIAEHLGSPELTTQDAERLRTLLDDCGARTYALELARELAERAAEHVQQGEVPAPLLLELEPLIETVLERSR